MATPAERLEAVVSESSEFVLDKLNRRSIDPDSPTPLYYQLFTMLHDAISSGELPTGSRMPSEKELASSFEVSRITARRALDELALLKMVARHRGRGTFVDYAPRPEPIYAPLDDLMASQDHTGGGTRIAVLELDFETPPSDLRELFDADGDEKLCRIVRVCSKAGVPFAAYHTWSRGFDRRLTRRQLEAKQRMELFRVYGIEIARVEHYLGAEGASPEVAKSLGIGTGKPLLRRVRHAFHRDGRVLDVLTALYNPDLFQYRMETVLG